MSRKSTTKQSLSTTIREHWSNRTELGGSKSSYVACYATNQVLGTLWRGRNEDQDSKEIRDAATMHRMANIGPRDVIEGMLAAQMIATHEAAMECFRRVHIPDQTLEGRELGLKYGDRLVRSFAALALTLDRHRGKGQQVVRVEHVTVQAGGQAIVGAITQGGGGHHQSEDQAHAPGSIAHEPQPEMRGADPKRQPLPVAGSVG